MHSVGPDLPVGVRDVGHEVTDVLLDCSHDTLRCICHIDLVTHRGLLRLYDQSLFRNIHFTFADFRHESGHTSWLHCHPHASISGRANIPIRLKIDSNQHRCAHCQIVHDRLAIRQRARRTLAHSGNHSSVSVISSHNDIH